MKMTARDWPKTGPKDESELSEWILGELKLEYMDEDMWLGLSRSGSVRRALNPPNRDGALACLEAARRYSEGHPEMRRLYGERPVRAVHKERPAKFPSTDDLARARLLRDRIAESIRQTDEYTSIRAELLGKHAPLTPAEGAGLLMSEATRFLHRSYFEAKSIPLIGHKTRVCLPDGSPVPSWDENVVIRIEWENGSHDVPYESDWFFSVPRSNESIAIPRKGGGAYHVSVAPASVLNELAEASRTLARFHPWEAHECLWFLLTDGILDAGPIRARSRAGGSITSGYMLGKIILEIDAWVPPDAVADAYQKIQARDFCRPQKSIGADKLRLWRFVEEARPDDAHEGTWEDLRLRWNRMNPRSKYSDFRTFARACKRTKHWVEEELLPPFSILPRIGKPEPKKRRKVAVLRLRRT